MLSLLPRHSILPSYKLPPTAYAVGGLHCNTPAQGGKTDKTKNVNHGFRTKKSGYGLEHFPEKDGHIFHYLNTPPRSFMKQ